MKRLIILLGFVSGVAVALFVLLKNPLAPNGIGSVDGPGTFSWTPLEFSGNAFRPENLLVKDLLVKDKLLGSGDPDVLDYASASVLLLQGADGQPVALATRLTSMARDNDLLVGNVGVDSYTNIFWPNRGSILMYGHENRWPLIARKALARIGQAPNIEQPDAYLVSADPTNGMPIGVVGGSGLWAGVGGGYQEVLIETDNQPGTYTGVLAVQLQNY